VYLADNWGVSCFLLACENKISLKKRFQKQNGFTLIEILIVVILLGILGTIIIPQLTISSDDAEFATLKANLNLLRRAIELYYYEHGNLYPGFRRQGGGGLDPGGGTLVKKQLTMYTSFDGYTNTKKTATYKFGPYIKGAALPYNPYNNLNDLKNNTTETDITVRASDGSTGWKFYAITGILMANDGGHDDL
jgi:prepilin-type N-terminal cleavage/methylation domain-containing protein